MQQLIGRFAALLVFIAVLSAFVFVFDLDRFLKPDVIEATIRDWGVWGPLLVIGLYILDGIILFFPSILLAVSTGYVFGPIWGTIFVVIGTTLGAMCSYTLARWLGEPFVDYWIDKNQISFLKKFEKRLLANGLITTFALRLIPIIPSNAMSYALGLMGVRRKDFLLGTFLGVVPIAIFYVYFGNSLNNWRWIDAIIAGLMLLSLICVAWFINKRLQKDT